MDQDEVEVHKKKNTKRKRPIPSHLDQTSYNLGHIVLENFPASPSQCWKFNSVDGKLSVQQH